MRGWREQLEERSFGWFVSVALLTAVAVVFCGGGFSGSPPVVGQVEPLRLTLSAPEICETEEATLRSGHVWDWGKDEAVSRIWGWRHNLMYVDWTVSGGEPPYTLTIDEESRDEYGDFSGASGTALVSCAQTHGPAVFWTQELRDQHFGVPEGREDVEVIAVAEERTRPRHYPEDEKPHVDSGPITIRATVVDGRGVTAEAAADVYVILLVNGGDTVMNPGKTYRVDHTLVTVPLGLSLEFGTVITSNYGPVITLNVISYPGAEIFLEDNGWRHSYADIFLEAIPTDNGWQYSYEGRILSPDIAPDEAAELDARINQLAASLGQPPSVGDDSP